ncbi:hypothetical protein KKB99_00270 [bacterium]|nr:hypothetical protein [bacterium]MBU1024419.1 hypothetical protein [bacterium]
MKFSNIIISGIVVVILAVAAVLLPVGDTSSRESFQLLKVEYGLDGAKQADNGEASTSFFDDWKLGVPEVSEKEIDIVRKTQRKPVEKLPIIASGKTVASLLKEEGFIPMTEPQEVQPGLILTIYVNAEGG